MSKNEDIEVRMTDDEREVLITSYIEDNMSDATLELFTRETVGLRSGCNRDVVFFLAAGQAVMNEAILNILKEKIKEEEEKQK